MPAVACAKTLRDETGSLGYLWYATDFNYVMAFYGVLSLLKVSWASEPSRASRAAPLTTLCPTQLLKHESKVFLGHEHKIISLVNDVAHAL